MTAGTAIGGIALRVARKRERRRALLGRDLRGVARAREVLRGLAVDERQRAGECACDGKSEAHHGSGWLADGCGGNASFITVPGTGDEPMRGVVTQ